MKRRPGVALLDDAQRRKAVEAIQSYFAGERDETIGMIAAEGFLDFVLAEIGKEIYNKALDDVRRWAVIRAQDLEVDFAQLFR